MRLFRIVGLLIASATFFVTSAASAVEFSVIGATTVTVSPGEAFTLDIALSNDSLTSTNGVVGTITGLAGMGATVISGVSAEYHFALFCSPSQCLGSLENNNNAYFDNQNLQNGAYTPGDDSVVIVSALSLAEFEVSGSLDPGLDGAFNVPSARDVTITLVANASGVLLIGGTYSQSGAQPITSTASVTVNVIPEPGIAVLIGLGLAGLAVAQRREAQPREQLRWLHRK